MSTQTETFPKRQRSVSDHEQALDAQRSAPPATGEPGGRAGDRDQGECESDPKTRRARRNRRDAHTGEADLARAAVTVHLTLDTHIRGLFANWSGFRAGVARRDAGTFLAAIMLGAFIGIFFLLA